MTRKIIKRDGLEIRRHVTVGYSGSDPEAQRKIIEMVKAHPEQVFANPSDYQEWLEELREEEEDSKSQAIRIPISEEELKHSRKLAIEMVKATPASFGLTPENLQEFLKELKQQWGIENDENNR